jgi:Ca2+-binding EF-hand superfamily protein
LLRLSSQEATAEPRRGVDARREAEWRWLFAYADRDRDGWISFREASVLLGIEMEEFRAYDADRDGAITIEEFFERLRAISLLGGAPPGPLPPPPPTPLRPSPLPPALDSLDPEAKGKIEFSRVLGAFKPSFARQAAIALLHFDRNRDGVLEGSELEGLGFEGASSGVPAPPPPVPEDAPIRAILSTLDLDGNGRLTPEEIAEHPVARRAVGLLPTFDGDGDGALDEEELRALWRGVTGAGAQSP